MAKKNLPPGALYNAAKGKSLRTSSAIITSEQNASRKYKKHKMVEGSKTDKAYDRKHGIKEGSKRDTPMKSKGKRHKFDLDSIGFTKVANTVGSAVDRGARAAGNAVGAVRNSVSNFGGAVRSGIKGAGEAAGRAIPGMGLAQQSANNLKAYKRKGIKGKEKGKRHKLYPNTSSGAGAKARDAITQARQQYTKMPSVSKTPRSSLLRDTITGIPAAAGRLASGAGKIVGGAGLGMYGGRAGNSIGMSMIKEGANQIGSQYSGLRNKKVKRNKR